jgi:hypothetical protein
VASLVGAAVAEAAGGLSAVGVWLQPKSAAVSVAEIENVRFMIGGASLGANSAVVEMAKS